MSAFHDNALMGASGSQGYQISRSVRLRSSASAYFNRTPSSASGQQTFTISAWVKRGTLAAQQVIFGINSASTNIFTLAFLSGDTLRVFGRNAGSDVLNLTTTAVYRDPSAWYHIVLAIDTTQATASNRARMYVNGVEVTAFGTATYPAQNTSLAWNSNSYAHDIGRESTGNYFDGYLTEINHISGTQLTPSSFGENDTVTGVWKPKKYAGTYGTNGFYLNFSDNSNNTAATIGKDYSGNGNNWTPNNISVTSGVTYDSMLDVPTPYADGNSGRGNYAVLNPLDQHGTSAYATVADGNLYWYGSYNTQNGHGIRSTLRVSPTGKWYVEASNVTYSGSGNSCMLGFTSSTQPITVTAFGGTLTPWIGVDASAFNNNIRFYSTGVSASLADGTTLFATCASGDVVSFAIDLSAGKIWIGKNGTWYNSGDPAAGTNATSTFSVGSAEWTFWAEYVAASTNVNRSSAVANFGQRPFSYTPPSGFKALNTQNLPEPTIKKGNQYFDVSTWTGTNSTGSRTITGLAFQPDLVWGKDRTSAFNHQLYDSVRGTGKSLASSSTSAEDTTNISGYISSFNSDGFTATVGSTDNWYWNKLNDAYAAWQWKAGNSSSSNTSGSITSTVSVNATAGFSVVTYTGTGANATVGHGLGVAPKMYIIKSRNLSSYWTMYHASLGNNILRLNTNDAAIANSAYFTSAPTSTLIYNSTSGDVNSNGGTYVAYCFSEVAGYSAFGSYTGNGSATGDGPFVYLGFRPRWLLLKVSSAAGFDWLLYDSSRDTYNVTNLNLRPDLSDAEGSQSANYLDFLSNGFKIRGTSSGSINPSQTIIYAAFAENPFKLSLAR